VSEQPRERRVHVEVPTDALTPLDERKGDGIAGGAEQQREGPHRQGRRSRKPDDPECASETDEQRDRRLDHLKRPYGP
jgi:hypothetical protein